MINSIMTKVRQYGKCVYSPVLLPVILLIALMFGSPATAEILNGAEKAHYPNGQLMYENNYVNGELEGASKQYYMNGTLRNEATYKNGKIDGIRRAYYPNGQLKTEVHYEDGKRNGARKTYFENGALHLDEVFVDGKRHGICRLYDKETGRLFTTSPYKNGKLDGTNYVHALRGPEAWLFIEDNYVDGKLHGKSLLYSSLDGTLVVKQSYYKDGKLNGLTTYYYDKNSAAPGKISKTETYRDGLLDGSTIYYDERGRQTRKERYQRGKKIR